MALRQYNHMPRHHTVGSSSRNIHNHQRCSSSSYSRSYAVEPITISHGGTIYRYNGHRFQYHRQYRSSFSVSSANQFHIEDDVTILDMPAMLSYNQIRLQSQNARISGGPAGNAISDKIIEDNIKIHRSCTNASSEASSDCDMCVVCQLEYEKDEEIGTLQCGHQYHLDCIKIWLRKKNTCPICKATAISV